MVFSGMEGEPCIIGGGGAIDPGILAPGSVLTLLLALELLLRGLATPAPDARPSGLAWKLVGGRPLKVELLVSGSAGRFRPRITSSSSCCIPW